MNEEETVSNQQSKRYRTITSNKKQKEDFLDHNEQIIIYEQENCCRCDAPIEAWQPKGLIDGEPAHAQCALDEMDETGMVDFHGGNG